MHGANKNRDFDVEFGTLNNLSADFSTIKGLEDSFKKNGIVNIKHNDPFMGGAITKCLYKIDGVEVIQLEINKNYRDLEKQENLEKLCNSLFDFITVYFKYNNE